jgi:hypothetical protein
MKILKILGVLVVILIILNVVGLFGFYTVESGMILVSKQSYEKKSCVGKNITIYDYRRVDGGAKFFCIGFVKTTLVQKGVAY